VQPNGAGRAAKWRRFSIHVTLPMMEENILIKLRPNILFGASLVEGISGNAQM
jgi:hypothetical protein